MPTRPCLIVRTLSLGISAYLLCQGNARIIFVWDDEKGQTQSEVSLRRYDSCSPMSHR